MQETVVADNGKTMALGAINGKASDRPLAGCMTWGFDYLWKVAGIEPWRLALGGHETWHKAHIRYFERHRPDFLFYSEAGGGPEDPSLENETSDEWIVRNGNSGELYSLNKTSYGLVHCASGRKGCDPIDDPIESEADVDRLFPEQVGGWSEGWAKGLSRLIAEVGESALVIPNYCTAYIAVCYTLGFERAMEMMALNPQLFLYMCDRFSYGETERLKRVREAGADVILIADAWASCDIISRATYQRFAMPYQAFAVQSAHQAGLKAIIWNEGDILPILDLQASIPMDAFYFEQPRKGVDLSVAKVREAFGPSRCLFGNLDSEGLLVENQPAKIAEAVHLQYQQSGNGCPFVLSTGSPLPSNVEPEAVDCVMKAAREYRYS